MKRTGYILIAYLGIVAAAAGWFLPRLNQPESRFDVARSLIADGRGAEAVHLLDDRVWRGVAEYRAERYRRAVEEFVQGDGVTALYNLGTAYARLGEWAGAREAYKYALALDPAHEDAAFNLSLVLQAEARVRAEAEAQRETRELGAEQSEAGGEEPAETGEDAKDDDAAPSADAAPSERIATQAGADAAAGRAGDAAQAPDAAAGRSAPSDAAEGDARGRTGAGAVRVLDASLGDAEMLLRAIRDDPAKVLRARLWAIDAKRREEGR